MHPRQEGVEGGGEVGGVEAEDAVDLVGPGQAVLVEAVLPAANGGDALGNFEMAGEGAKSALGVGARLQGVAEGAFAGVECDAAFDLPRQALEVVDHRRSRAVGRVIEHREGAPDRAVV